MLKDDDDKKKVAWHQSHERGSLLGMLLLKWIALALGRKAINIVLVPIVAYYCLGFATARYSSRQFLEHVLRRKVGLAKVFKHFYTFAQVTVDRLFFLSGRFSQFSINLEGEVALLNSLSTGRGCILLMSHFGSFEAVRAAGHVQNIRPKLLMDKHYAKKAMALFSATNPALADDIIDADQRPETLVLQLRDVVENGDMLGVMGDRVFRSDRRLSVDFFGKSASFPAGPWLLAITLRVPVVACFSSYRGLVKDASGRRKPTYDIAFVPLAEPNGLARKERQSWVASGVQSYAKVLESHVKKSPYNWFNFYNIWNVNDAENH